uniref:Uncharacterized protein n=1 Tax=Gopherus agassizii TaxID=38772 RepID=A0A452HAR7_9SAUR
MLCNYCTIPDTPEIERIKNTQKNISSVSSKEVKHATAISDPPEIRRVKENQKNISNVQYKEQPCKATPVTVTPEMERVKKNQEIVHYKGQPAKATSVSVTPEMERVKKNQDNISSASCLNLFALFIFITGYAFQFRFDVINASHCIIHLKVNS